MGTLFDAPRSNGRPRRLGLIDRRNTSQAGMRGYTVPNRVFADPHIHFGKPCVAGTRIPVQCVLELVREGISPATIISEYYPDLHADDIRASVQYAIDLITLEDIRLAEAV